jgi:hypothetical protein
MYLEISYDDDHLADIFFEEFEGKPSGTLQALLESLWDIYNVQYGLSDAYNEPGEWVTDLQIAAIYKDPEGDE